MWSENSVQMEESENWDILSDEWWVMKIEWWKLSDEKVLTKQGLNHFRQYLSLWPFLIEIGPHGSAKKKNAAFWDLVWPNGLREELDPVLTVDNNDFSLYLLLHEFLLLFVFY